MGGRQDEFEAKNMRADAPVLHRDKRVSRGMAGLFAVVGLLTMVLGVYVGMVNDTASRPASPGALPFVVGGTVALGLALWAIGIMFAVVRTLVTAHEVHVKYGLWGPRIALQDIRSCKVVDYDWTEFGGWGIRLGKDGTWAYVPGGPRVVEMRYVDGAKEKRVLVGADDPDETARAINLARRPEATTKLRIEGDSANDQATFDEAADEDANEATADGAKRSDKMR